MKLLILTAVSAFEQQIKRALKTAKVSAFSYTHVTGYTEASNDDMDDNWFSSSAGEHNSILFYAFVQDELVDQVMERIDSFNEQEASISSVHVSVVDILKQNKF